MNQIRIIWKSNNKEKDKKVNDKIGYLYLSQRVGGKTILKTMGLPPIKYKDFNHEKGLVKKSDKNYEELNILISQQVEKSKKLVRGLQFKSDDKKFLTEFIREETEKATNIGTKQKYININNLLSKFHLNKYGTEHVKFIDVTSDYIEEFRSWLMSNQKNTEDTATYKLKSFKAFINKARKRDIYSFPLDPFRTISKRIERRKRLNHLDAKGLKILMNHPIQEVYRSEKDKSIYGKPLPPDHPNKYKQKISLNDYRNVFLFQVFANGMRVSDAITLRWSNFYTKNDEIRFNKQMLKVKGSIDVLINYQTGSILLNHLPEDLKIEDEDKNTINVSLPALRKRREDLELDYQKIKVKPRLKVNPQYTNIKGEICINDINKELVKLKYEQQSGLTYDKKKLTYLQDLERDIIELATQKANENKKYYSAPDELMYYLLSKYIKNITSNPALRNKFVFPILQDDDFLDIKNDEGFRNMNKNQYLKFSGGRSYYNRNLKHISAQCGLIPINTHMARHTFTSIVNDQNDELNLHNLMRALGHANLTTTQEYISSFSTSGVDSLNKKLSDTFR